MPAPYVMIEQERSSSVYLILAAIVLFVMCGLAWVSRDDPEAVRLHLPVLMLSVALALSVMLTVSYFTPRLSRADPSVQFAWFEPQDLKVSTNWREIPRRAIPIIVAAGLFIQLLGWAVPHRGIVIWQFYSAAIALGLACYHLFSVRTPGSGLRVELRQDQVRLLGYRFQREWQYGDLRWFRIEERPTFHQNIDFLQLTMRNGEFFEVVISSIIDRRAVASFLEGRGVCVAPA